MLKPFGADGLNPFFEVLLVVQVIISLFLSRVLDNYAVSDTRKYIKITFKACQKLSVESPNYLLTTSNLGTT